MPTENENRVENLIAKLKDLNSNPIAVGFGISTPDHVNKVREWGADAVSYTHLTLPTIYSV